MTSGNADSELFLALSSELKCAVCTNIYRDDPYSFACGHTLCSDCMEESVERMGVCPFCRAKISKRSAFRVPMLGKLAKIIRDEAFKCKWTELATQFGYTQ